MRKIDLYKKLEYVFNWIELFINTIYLIWWIFALVISIKESGTYENFHQEIFIYVSIIFIIISICIIVLNCISIMCKKREICNSISLIIAIYLVLVSYLFFNDRWTKIVTNTATTREYITFIVTCIIMVLSICNIFISIRLKLLNEKSPNNIDK